MACAVSAQLPQITSESAAQGDVTCLLTGNHMIVSLRSGSRTVVI